jgi:hypothetical protein
MVLRQRTRTVAVPVAAQEAEKIGPTQVENLLRSLQTAARHQPAADFKQQVTRRPERRYHTGFTRFSQGKAPLHLPHKPPQQRAAPERQARDLSPSGGAHLAWVAVERGIEHAAYLVKNVARVIAPPWIEDVSFIHRTMSKISQKPPQFMPKG